ncbi:MAG: hypothetical protein J6S34_03750 [Clostridia bacterium]|nr:hypothetical protein [Clostridia bacterium]
MDQNVPMTETVASAKNGHFSKCKHVYIYILSILLIAGLLFGAFQFDMMRTEGTEAENEKQQGYIKPIGMNLSLYEAQKRQEIRNEYNKQLNKESAFLMLITLDASDKRVEEYTYKGTVWSRLTRNDAQLTALAAQRFGVSGATYDALHTFFFNEDESVIADITPAGMTTEDYLAKLHAARDLVEKKETAIVDVLNPDDPEDQDEIEKQVEFYLLNLLIWNPQAAPDNERNNTGTAVSIASISTLWRIIVLLAAVAAFAFIIAKTSGQYSIGFAFPSQAGWATAVIVMLPFLVLGTLYGMMGNLSSTMYQIILAVFMAFFIAFGCFALRKAGAGKLVRVIVPLVATYAVFAIFYFASSGFQYIIEYAKEQIDHFTAFELMTYEIPHLVALVLFGIAPLFMVVTYTLTNSIVAMIVPTLFVNIFGAVFPAMIQVNNPEFYVYLYLVLVALYIVATITMLVMVIMKLVKKLPFGGDILCEHYAEDAPEVTFPAAYLEKKAAAKAAKEDKKAAKGDFAFLNDSEKAE